VNDRASPGIGTGRLALAERKEKEKRAEMDRRTGFLTGGFSRRFAMMRIADRATRVLGFRDSIGQEDSIPRPRASPDRAGRRSIYVIGGRLGPGPPGSTVLAVDRSISERRRRRSANTCAGRVSDPSCGKVRAHNRQAAGLSASVMAGRLTTLLPIGVYEADGAGTGTR